MKIQELFTRKDIESYGFIYESDITKCKTGKTRIHYNGSYIDETGNLIHSESPVESGYFTEKQFKDEVASEMFYKYINSIFVIIPDSISCEHVHNKVMFTGHTPKSVKTEEAE